ncbi:hypothetical protein CROQUDRAFT_652314 [Cronartium quercuum f. sp. fusiforme G11]|uniref:Uncharacterized protein n=1 Tax=Cronartium quercuum f. sp. fusiforme G11 TaxID=708437 RepID=A0A9P6NU98_9BASI|nr:hypothetical protein CROQUDRAFT_652314 [Cronartium quercuum f. sp. fusiforme G11]
MCRLTILSSVFLSTLGTLIERSAHSHPKIRSQPTEPHQTLAQNSRPPLFNRCGCT